MPPKFSENIVILCFERHFSKQNSVIRLKSNILPPKIFGLATPLSSSTLSLKVAQDHKNAKRLALFCYAFKNTSGVHSNSSSCTYSNMNDSHQECAVLADHFLFPARPQSITSHAFSEDRKKVLYPKHQRNSNTLPSFLSCRTFPLPLFRPSGATALPEPCLTSSGHF